MKPESEVSIPFALSIFLDKEFTPDDDTLNNESYKELGLTCGKCRELIFFKPGRKRVSHFSHFKDTGKGCRWRTESHSNTQDSDSSKREQSLQEFQTKFKGIIERAIIQYQKISYSQLLSQIVNGKILVAEYNINIEAWLRWFNENRNKVENVALALYQKNELLSDMNSKVLLNLLDYLCVPASEYILRELLYYVVFLLNKERGVNNNLEKVCSKVIEIISFAEWKKEYKRAKELVDTSKFEQDAHQEIVDFREYEIAPITFKRIDHPNVEEKTPKSQIQVERKIPQPVALDGSKSAPGSLEVRAVIGKTPMILTMEQSGNKWTLVALPLRVPPYHLAVYLSDKLNKLDLVSRVRREIETLKKQAVTLDNDQVQLLETLLSDILVGKKPSNQEVVESTRIIDGYLKKSGIREKSSYSDNYYRLHTLGYVSLVQEVERNLPSYTLTVLGDEKDTRRSAVPSAIYWLKRIPGNLQRVFGEKVPSYSEIKDYLMENFPYKEAHLVINDKNECIISIYYDGKLQTKQQLAIFKPVRDDKISGKVSVKFNSTVTWVGNGEFANLLKCSIADIHLIQDSQAQVGRIVQKFINSNAQRFIGSDKIATKTPTRNILGFSEKSRGYGGIVKTFMRFCTPFCKESEVDQGKFVNLHTLEVYDKHDATKLLETMTNNWKKWNKEKEDKIELAGELVKKHDPGRLMIGIHGLVTHKPEISTIVWDSVITQFYLLTDLPIGFRLPNGVLLTPWDILPNRIDLWTYRIKIQLIDILYKGQKGKIETAEYYLKSKDENLVLKGRELIEEARKGSVKSWLQMSIAKLYQALEKSYPTWEKEVSQDVLNHLAALHDALAVCENIN